MTIQWYPGHMAKAQRLMKEKLKLIDVIIELVDARIPLASRNPMVDDIAGQKPRFVLLNKKDMADENVTSEWQKYFADQGATTLAVNSQNGNGVKQIPDAVHRLNQARKTKMESKGYQSRADRALILGIPNVGKSTLINRLANKKKARIGDRPGVTKGQQWIKVGKTMELLDTPGILWPKFADESVGFKLAATGAIKDELIDFQETAVFLLKVLITHYPDALKSRYNLDESFDEEAIVSLFDTIGQKRGCIMAGGRVDYDKTSEIILRDYRSGKLGALSLETPEAFSTQT
ncbi:ribosome biogenesis GTPase YlqF [Tuberibacillus sp. Marseille-P3662]|uniref:ribosome biogenesis GTPase YlqF n=1 Tax=Tuberibacillus sp. Marseille-P3662 TaxID=1965358 RepID=UPI000A1C8493|nr:ribosome biogenesis GTPase YlqF [Tuberibacillus sp. Marseille-P3662]